MAAISAHLRDLLGRGRRVAALTGAGVSAESGVPTFRSPGGFWDNESLLDLANPCGVARSRSDSLSQKPPGSGPGTMRVGGRSADARRMRGISPWQASGGTIPISG